MKNSSFIFLFFFLASCGFSSGLYQDILKAQDHIEKREFKKAVEVYESLLLKKPSHNVKIKVHDQLGSIYSIYLADYKNSLKHYKSIVEFSNEPRWQVKSLEKIAQIYFENLKSFHKAKDIYKKLVNFLPQLENYPFYEFRYALSLFHLKLYRKSIVSFKNMITRPRGNYKVDCYYYIGLAYFYERKWKLANEYWFEYLKREKRKDKIIKTKFLIANSYESAEKLKKAYNIYYSLLGEYPNPEIIKGRLDSLYKRRVSRKR